MKLLAHLKPNQTFTYQTVNITLVLANRATNNTSIYINKNSFIIKKTPKKIKII